MRNSNWYICRVTPRAEEKARTALRRIGIGCYIPKMRIERQHRRTKRWTTSEHYLLPGYVFIEFPYEERDHGGPRFDDWRKLRSCDGIKEIMGISTGSADGTEPYAIPGAKIERMMRKQANLEFDDTRAAKLRRQEIGKNQRETVTMRYPPGTRIRAKDGPFASFGGMVTNVTAKGEIEALIDLFGRLVPATFPIAHIEGAADEMEAA